MSDKDKLEPRFLKIRQRYYFTDRTDEINTTKRILKVLNIKVKNGVNKLSIADIIRSLRWSFGVFNQNYLIKKNRIPKVSKESKISDILGSLEILEYLELIKYSSIGEESLDTTIEIIYVKDDKEFDNKLNDSELIPICGKKQILTKNMLEQYLDIYNIDYLKTTEDYFHLDNLYKENVNLFIPILEELWHKDYAKMVGKRRPLTKFPSVIKESDSLHSYCLFDDYSMIYDIDVLDDDFIEDRTVVTYGFSKNKITTRKKKDYEMKYDNTRKWTDKQTDLGHYAAHAIGGNIWTNIFPQKRDINQGKSEKGKVYREMERYLERNEGIFFFSRPIYFDFSYRPYILEFGYLTKEYRWVIEYFENV